MKRILPLTLALLLLAACGTPGAEVTATPAPLSFDGEQPDYIPPMDFTPVSVWQAETFGSNGRALLYMGHETDGVIPFKVFAVNKFYFSGGDIPYARSLDCRSFSGSFRADGDCYTFDASFYTGDSERYHRYLIEAACIDDISGSANINGDMLTMNYISATPDGDSVSLKTDFATSTPSAECSWGENDTSPKKLYLPSSFIKLPEEQLSQAMYQMPAFVEELDSDGFRSLGVGDSIIDILFRIPRYDEYAYWDQLRSDALSIYGAGAMNWFSTLILTNEEGKLEVYVQAFDIITYTLDEDFNIESVEYYEQFF